MDDWVGEFSLLWYGAFGVFYVRFTGCSVAFLKKTCVRVARRSDVESRGGVCSGRWRRCARVLVDCDRSPAWALRALAEGLSHPLDATFCSATSGVFCSSWCSSAAQCCTSICWKSLCAS